MSEKYVYYLEPGDVICTGTPVKKVKSDPPVWLKPE